MEPFACLSTGAGTLVIAGGRLGGRDGNATYVYGDVALFDTKVRRDATICSSWSKFSKPTAPVVSTELPGCVLNGALRSVVEVLKLEAAAVNPRIGPGASLRGRPGQHRQYSTNTGPGLDVGRRQRDRRQVGSHETTPPPGPKQRLMPRHTCLRVHCWSRRILDDVSCLDLGSGAWSVDVDDERRLPSLANQRPPARRSATNRI